MNILQALDRIAEFIDSVENKAQDYAKLGADALRSLAEWLEGFAYRGTSLAPEVTERASALVLSLEALGTAVSSDPVSAPGPVVQLLIKVLAEFLKNLIKDL